MKSTATLGVLLIVVTGCATQPKRRAGTAPYPIYHVARSDRPVTRTTTPTPTPRPKRRASERRSPTAHALGWYPKRTTISRRWKHIVLHHSATSIGGAKRFDKYHRETRGWNELGYHFVIGNGSDTPDGYVEVGPRWEKQKHGAHCKTRDNYFNDHGIGICLVGDFTRTRPSPAQLASLTKLVRFLSVSCGISPGNISRHGAITGKTQCPGRYFPIASLRRAVSTTNTASVYP